MDHFRFYRAGLNVYSGLNSAVEMGEEAGHRSESSSSSSIHHPNHNTVIIQVPEGSELSLLTSTERGCSLEEDSFSEFTSPFRGQEALGGVSGRGAFGAGGGGVQEICWEPKILSWCIMRNSTSAAW